MFTDFLFPSYGSGGSNAPLTQPAENPARPSLIDDEFSRLAQRSPTATEHELLSMVAARLSPDIEGSAPHGKGPLSIWADGLLSEALTFLATTAGACGGRVLLVSPYRDLLSQRQLRLSRRAPFFPLRDGAKSAAGRRAETAWATPDELDPAVLARVFGASGPQFIFVEEAQTATPSAHTFRPSFERLRAVLHRYPQASLICSSSLSTTEIRSDVAKRLARPELATGAPLIESALFSEATTELRVLREEDLFESTGGASRNERLAATIAELPRPALVLCATVSQADEVYSTLFDAQLPVHRYHSGLPESERAKHLVQFALPGRRAVMVATSGFLPSSGFSGEPMGDVPDHFGPGYCRRDIRSLVHLAAPASLEQFSLELRMLDAGPRPNSHLAPSQVSQLNDAQSLHELPGQAPNSLDQEDGPENEESSESSIALGSSGRSTVALLVYHPAQLVLLEALLQRKRPPSEALIELVEALIARGTQWISESELSAFGLQSRKLLKSCALFLVDAGLIEMRDGDLRTILSAMELRSRANELGAALDRLREGDVQRLREVASYAEAETCRTIVLSMLLGRIDHEDRPSPCGQCDVCAAQGHVRATQGHVRATQGELRAAQGELRAVQGGVAIESDRDTALSVASPETASRANSSNEEEPKPTQRRAPARRRSAGPKPSTPQSPRIARNG